MNKYLIVFIFVVFFAPVIAVYETRAESEKVEVEIDIEKLKAGTIQTFSREYKVEGKGTKKCVIGVIFIDAPCKKVWNFISDWDKMGEHIPGLKYYKTLSRINENEKIGVTESIIEGYVKIPIPFINRLFTLDVKFNNPEWRIDWKMLNQKEIEYYRAMGIQINKSSPFVKNIEGFGYLEPYNNNTQSIFYYVPTLEITIPVPGIVERFLSVTGLKGFLKAVKTRSEVKQYDHISIY